MDIATGNCALTLLSSNTDIISKYLGYTRDDATVFVFTTLNLVREFFSTNCIRRIFGDIVIGEKKYVCGEKIDMLVREIPLETTNTEYLFEISYGKRTEKIAFDKCGILPDDIHTAIIGEIPVCESGCGNTTVTEHLPAIPTQICITESDAGILVDNIYMFPDKNARFYVPDLHTTKIPAGSKITYFKTGENIDGEYYFPHITPKISENLKCSKTKTKTIIPFNGVHPVRYIEIKVLEKSVAACIKEVSILKNSMPIFTVDSRTMKYFPGNSDSRIVIPFSGNCLTSKFPEFILPGTDFDMKLDVSEDCSVEITLHCSNVIKYKDGFCCMMFAR